MCFNDSVHTQKKKKKKNIIWLCTCHLYNRMAEIYIFKFNGSAVIENKIKKVR